MAAYIASFVIIILFSVFIIPKLDRLTPFLRTKALMALFFIKILAGVVYVYVNNNIIRGGDIQGYFKDGQIIYSSLQKGDMASYIKLCFYPNNIQHQGNLTPYIDAMGFWFDTPAYLIVRLNALFNLISQGESIYLNALFFSIISFFACILLVLVFRDFFKTQSKWISLFIFLTPSSLFWTSGMHKETLSVFFAALAVFSLFKLIDKLKIRFAIIFFHSTLLLILLRTHVVILFIPALSAYILWYHHKKTRPFWYFLSAYLFFGLLAWVIPYLISSPTAVDVILREKKLFEALEQGNTSIQLQQYNHNLLSIASKIPQALFNTLVRPHFKDINSFPLFLASIESFFISIMLIASLFYFKYLDKNQRAIAMVFTFFSITYLVLTGLIIPNIGAIMRYRSVALFFLVPVLAYTLGQKNKLLS